MLVYIQLYTYLYYVKVYRKHGTVSNLPVRIPYTRKFAYFSLALLRRIYISIYYTG